MFEPLYHFHLEAGSLAERLNGILEIIKSRYY